MTAILVQILAGFIMAKMGIILLFHLDIWAGLILMVVGIFFVLRATHRINVCN